MNCKQITSLAGGNPHPNESVKTIGYRNTRSGRGQVKRLLFTAAMSASKSKGVL